MSKESKATDNRVSSQISNLRKRIKAEEFQWGKSLSEKKNIIDLYYLFIC